MKEEHKDNNGGKKDKNGENLPGAVLCRECMSHPECSGSVSSIFSLPKPEVSRRWEQKENQELGESRPKGDR